MKNRLQLVQMFNSILIVFSVLFVALSGIFSEKLYANDRKETAIGLQYGHGFLINHSPEVRYLEAGRFNSLELNYEWVGRGEEDWHHLYRFPSSGLLFSYTDFGNSQTLGSKFTLANYIKFPILHSQRGFQLHVRLAMGLSYLQKPFDPVNNSRNLAIGSHLNAFVQGMVGISYPIADHWGLSAGVQIGHFSNGSYTKPNKGMNYPMLTLGISRTLNKKESFYTSTGHEQIGNFWNALVSVSMKSPHISSTSTYGVVTLGIAYNRGINNKLFWMAGTDLVYNAANRRGEEERRPTAVSRSVNFQAGVYIGLGMKYGPTSIYLTKGYQVLSYSLPTDGIYHRMGIRRDLNDRVFLHGSIYSNYFKANFLDIGVGIKI